METFTCRFVCVKGPNRGQRCQIRPRNGEFCSKHATSKIAVEAIKPQLPIDPEEVVETIKDRHTVNLLADPILGDGAVEVVDGGAVKKPKKGQRKLKEKSTVIMVTLNSNQPLGSMDDKAKTAFKELAAQIFDGNGPVEFLSDRTHDNPADVIKSIDSKYHFEVSAANLLHLHGIIKIVHTGFLKWHANKVRDLAISMLGHNVYLNSPISSDPVHSWEQYIAKTQGAVVI